MPAQFLIWAAISCACAADVLESRAVDPPALPVTAAPAIFEPPAQVVEPEPGDGDYHCRHDERGNWVCILTQTSAVENHGGPCGFGPQGELVASFQGLRETTGASAIVSRFDGAGKDDWTRVWNRSTGYPTHTLWPRALGVRADGSVVWGGSDCRNDPTAPAPADPDPWYAGSCIDAFVAALDARGESSWELHFGARDGVDFVSAVALAADGGVYLGGLYQAPLVLQGLSPSLAGSGGSDLFVLALDRSGQPRWARSFGTQATEGNGVRLAARANGELAVRGGWGQQSVGGFAALLGEGGSMIWQREVQEYALAEIAWLGDELVQPLTDSLRVFTLAGDPSSRALSGSAPTSLSEVLPNGNLVLFTAGRALLEAKPNGEVVRSRVLGDASEAWYYGGLCVSKDGAVGVTGKVGNSTDFGFLDQPITGHAGSAFVLHLAAW